MRRCGWSDGCTGEYDEHTGVKRTGNQFSIQKQHLLFVYSRPFNGLEDLERERIVERRRGI